MRLYGKVYDGADELKKRKAIFESNVAKINAHNSRDETVRMGTNQFSDLSPDEFKLLVSRPYVPRSNHTVETYMKAGSLPSSVDWTTKGAVTAVKNQGSCGSCWAFSTTGSIEGAYFLATGSLRSLSEQQLVDCSKANNGCNGGSFQNAYSYIINNSGIDSESDYAYQATGFPCWVNATKRRIAQISSFKNVPANNEAQLELAVSQGPVSVAIEADQAVFQSYKSGIISNASCGTSLDHGVLIVGYGTEDGTDYWKVKNSWGASWGEAGFVRIKRGAGLPQGICGINMDAAYPIVDATTPLPIPPPTPGGQPKLPCNCTMNCYKMCKQFGMVCCGDGVNCNCSPQSACPKCQ